MKKLIYSFYRALFSLLLLFGIVMTSCKQEDLPIKVESVTLNVISVTMSVGDTLTLTAIISPFDAENQRVLWSTSNANVVTVKDGIIRAVAAGEATVVVKTDDGGKTAECAVVVKGTNEGDGTEEGEDDEYKWPIASVLGTVTATTVQFDMTLDISYMSGYQEAGLIFSPVDDLDVAVEGVTIFQLTREHYSKVFEGLAYNTAYYYTTYLKKDGFYLYGEKAEFTTSNVLLGLSVASSTATTAQITGIVEGLSESDKSLIEIGLLYSSESGQVENGQGTKLAASEIPSDNAVSFDLSDLMFGTKYYYCSYVKQGGSYTYGTPAEFTTLKHPYDIQHDLNVSAAKDMSSSGSANCYIISESGLYKYKAVKGNSNESVGSVASASILWETFGTDMAPELFDLISGFCYKDGYIGFQTADTFKEGNAVIAAKDANGNILWSWHIWFTDQPQEQTYYNSAGTMMDRNLGATSATSGDVGALGLLYQWGRKEPFLGSSSISSLTLAKSTIAWPSSVSSDSSNGTIEYATAHPTTFITYNSNNYDWYYTGDSSTDNTRWTTSDNAKSIYDPCPAGWRVPDGGDNGIWSKAIGSSSNFDHPYNDSNEGMNFSGKFGSASTIWYPASGYRNSSEGGLSDVGGGGRYWSASPSSYDSYSAYYLYFLNSGFLPSVYLTRANGYSVRCLQE